MIHLSHSYNGSKGVSIALPPIALGRNPMFYNQNSFLIDMIVVFNYT
jgi:hypothetical protein